MGDKVREITFNLGNVSHIEKITFPEILPVTVNFDKSVDPVGTAELFVDSEGDLQGQFKLTLPDMPGLGYACGGNIYRYQDGTIAEFELTEVSIVPKALLTPLNRIA